MPQPTVPAQIDANIPRNQVAAIIHRLQLLNTVGLPAQLPTLAQSWLWAIGEEVTDGTNPTSLITREQCVTMLHRYHIGASTTIAQSWRWAIDKGITDGTRPRDQISRQEAVTMLHRLSRL